MGPINSLHLCSLLAFFFAADAYGAKSLLPPEFQNEHCASSLDKTIRDWGTLGEWQQRLGAHGEIELWSPSETIGSWVEIRKAENGNLNARRLSPDSVVEALWFRKECIPAIAPTPLAQKAVENGFSDRDLADLIHSGKNGIVYLWSPHMPLSITGVENILKLVKSENATAVFLLDPNADPDLAKKIQREHHWPSEYLRRADSLELAMRNALIHFPNLLFFSKGRMHFEMAPGLKTVKNYRNLLREQLKR